VRVGLQGATGQPNVTIASERGYFAEQGLDIEFVQFNSGPEMIPAMATNQIQVGNGAPSVALYNALSRGVDIRIVADSSHIRPDPSEINLSLMVRKSLWDSGAVRSMADLRGRVVAIGPTPGTPTDMLYQRALAQDGVSATDIDGQYMSFADMMGALGNGKVDGAILAGSLVTQALDNSSFR